MDKDLYTRFIKSLKENNISIEDIKKDIDRKEKYREMQCKYNKKRKDKFNGV